jgi:O-antigen biosynthesis protein
MINPFRTLSTGASQFLVGLTPAAQRKRGSAQQARQPAGRWQDLNQTDLSPTAEQIADQRADRATLETQANYEQPVKNQPVKIQPVEQALEPSKLAVSLAEADSISHSLEATTCLEQGQAWFRQGDLAAAIRYYRQAIHYDPSLGEAYQSLAEALTEQGDLTAAAECYRLAIAVANQQVQPFSHKAPNQKTPNQEALNRDSQPQSLSSAKKPPANASSNNLIHLKPVEPAQNRNSSASQHSDVNATGTLKRRKRHLSQTKSSPTQSFQPNRTATSPSWFEQVSFQLQQGMVHCNAGAWGSAITACETALQQLEPQAYSAYLTLGRALQQQKQFEAAETAYRKAAVLQPKSAEVQARLGSVFADQQRWHDATQFYQIALQLDPKFAGAYWKLAEIWQQLGSEEQTLFCLHQAYSLQPAWGSELRYCQLAQRLLKLGQLNLAQTYYERALKLNGSCFTAQVGLGQVFSQQGQIQSAIATYEQVIARLPLEAKTAHLYAEMATALLDWEQWETALVCYQRWAKLVPSAPLALISGIQQCYIQLERWAEALPYCQQRVEQQPEATQWHQLGEVLSQLGRWSEAVASYQQAIEMDSAFSWSHHNLGAALLQLERWSEAATAFAAAIALHPDFVWSHYNLGEARTQLADWDGAIAAYQAALKLQPDLSYAAVHLANALQQRAASDRTQSLACYHQAIRRNPQDPDLYYKALELDPEATDLYLGLIEALAHHGRYDEALVCCQIARQFSPDSVELNHLIQQILRQREVVCRPQPDWDRASDYERWMQQHSPSPEDLRQMTAALSQLNYQPCISVLMPVYNPPPAFLDAAIQSVLEQVYPHWQLCIADDASTDPAVRQILDRFAAQDSRIQVLYRQQNGHISAASNSALSLASGDFIALLDHDDRLAPEALYEVAVLLNRHPSADMIYSDEDKLDAQGNRVQPFFKPDWCPDSFLSRMYTCHLGVYRRAVVEAIGGFRVGYEGSQDYDLVLRFTEQTERIFHLPKVLYHWRAHSGSVAGAQAAKPYATEAAKLALAEACQRRGEAVRAVVSHPESPGVYTIRYQIQTYQRVSIIIPTRNFGELLDRCLESIFTKTTYPNYDVLVIDNGSDEVETLEVISHWQQREPNRFQSRLLDIPFNFSQLNNIAVGWTSGSYLLFLNNDVEVITPDWIEAMVEQAQRSAVGAVGAQLFYPDHTVQHAGVVLGIGGIAGHSHKYYAKGDKGYLSQLISTNNYSAVTAACLMCRREAFLQAEGFDESLAVAFNDVDFCLKLTQLGYRNVYLPHVQLYHHESKSRGAEDTPYKQQRFLREQQIMQTKWSNLLQNDPCYSPHLTLKHDDYSLRI